MYNRRAINNLREWKKSINRKPLVLRGARQVGKTTLVRMFSKEFSQFIELILERPEHKSLFETDRSFDELITAIFFLAKKQKNIANTLIFIDEIQNSPAAVAHLRFFYEDTPQYAVIAAGSMLESLIDRHISFPVGRVEYLAIRPCSFYEYLEAHGELESVV